MIPEPINCSIIIPGQLLNKESESTIDNKSFLKKFQTISFRDYQSIAMFLPYGEGKALISDHYRFIS